MLAQRFTKFFDIASLHRCSGRTIFFFQNSLDWLSWESVTEFKNFFSPKHQKKTATQITPTATQFNFRVAETAMQNFDSKFIPVLDEDESDDQDDGLPQPNEHSGYVPEVTDRMYGDEEDDAAGRERYGGLEVPTGMNQYLRPAPFQFKCRYRTTTCSRRSAANSSTRNTTSSYSRNTISSYSRSTANSTTSSSNDQEWPTSEATDALRKKTMEVSRSLAVW